MSDAFLGEIRMTGFNFAPSGWALCDGQILAISSNAALFSLLGTTYGGDGVQTFNLPNLQSRVPIHQGNGLGLSQYVMGQSAGTESVTLLQNQMPQHNHLLEVSNASGTVSDPTNALPAQINTGTPRSPNFVNAYTAGATGNMAVSAISLAGGNLPHNNVQPYLVVNFIIALQGIYPSRG